MSAQLRLGDAAAVLDSMRVRPSLHVLGEPARSGHVRANQKVRVAPHGQLPDFVSPEGREELPVCLRHQPEANVHQRVHEENVLELQSKVQEPCEGTEKRKKSLLICFILLDLSFF